MNCFMEKKELEDEFSEFLIQKIKQAGGSLPLQHLFGYLQYATFEVRKEFGTTKRELMKYLKAHSKIFYIDPDPSSGGMVTVTSPFSTTDPGSDENDSDEDEDDINIEESTSTRVKNIENGFGNVIKLHPEFGIIKAVKPFETEVYFKSDVFIGNQDKVLTECLEVESEVCFNAVYGHNDLDIKFLATSVWRNRNDNCDDISENQKALSNDFEGDGVVHKIFSDKGFILVSGKKKKIVFFDKNSVIDRNGMELAKFLKVGDPVSFSASIFSETNSKSQWRATVVKKKSKEKPQSKSNTKIKVAVQNKIENEQGKIYPHSRGAIIKFRSNELADGDSSNYFLYGIEVKDIKYIAWEFSEGDDVWFDAVKTKSAPGWKAVCVWVGEKPEYVNRKIDSDEEIKDISNNSRASYQKNNLTVNLKSKTLKSDGETPILQRIQSKSPLFDHAVVKNPFPHYFEDKRQNSESQGNIQNFPPEKSYKRGGIKPRNEILSMKKNKSSHNSERQVKRRSNPRNLTVNRLKSTTVELNMEMDNTSSHLDDDLSYKDEESDISERSFPDNEFQDMIQKDVNFLKERYKSFENEDQSDFEDDESDIDNADEIKHYKSSVEGRPSIKTFEDIEGEIIILYCKAAIVKCSELQGNVDFLLNVFYINGKSVEEQQVIDLKEIIKVGDHVNINCFEIVDDFGKIYHKVTLAWKGSKPNVYEMTPKEFIDESELSVTLSDELVPEYLLGERKSSQSSLEETSKETAVTKHGSADFSNMCDMQTDKHNFEENNLSIDPHKLLSEMIIHRLKSKGLISADLQVDFSDMLTQVISLTQNHDDINSSKNITNEENVQQKVCSTCTARKRSVFTHRNKSEKHADVQTIVTGGIIAQSIYTQN